VTPIEQELVEEPEPSKIGGAGSFTYCRPELTRAHRFEDSTQGREVDAIVLEREQELPHVTGIALELLRKRLEDARSSDLPLAAPRTDARDVPRWGDHKAMALDQSRVTSRPGNIFGTGHIFL
jgi:hypothetical protein